MALDDRALSEISLVVGLVSLAASVVFFALANKAERRTRDVLDRINAAIQGWQASIMSSVTELLESRVEIVGKRAYLEEAKAKHEFLAGMSERIKYIIENAASGDGAHAQSRNLELLLKYAEVATKPTIVPESGSAPP